MTTKNIKSSTLTIVNKKGLHARAAARFVKTASGYDATIMVRRADQEVSGDSIMGLLTLAASQGRDITITTQGNMAQEALDELCCLVQNGFYEEESE